MSAITIRDMREIDGPLVLEIYRLGIGSGQATFETSAPSWKDWNNNHLEHSRFVALMNDRVAGWVAISPVSQRAVYKGVSEVSIYVHPGHHGKGIGSALMDRLIKSSEEHGIWTLYSAVFPENAATMRLHEKSGFRIIGTREKIAQLHGVWRDTVLLERRSHVVGV
jgi:L-amino acid N-acyltransferase YncA